MNLVIRHFQRIRNVRYVQTVMLNNENFETIRDKENVLLEKIVRLFKIV